MKSVFFVQPSWAASSNAPVGYSLRRKSVEQYWDFKAETWAAAPAQADVMRPLAQSASPLHQSLYSLDVPPGVDQVRADVLVFFHAPDASGVPLAVDGCDLAAPEPALTTPLRPIAFYAAVG